MPADSRASQATRERLLKAAEGLFLAHGYDGTSARLITAAARANLAAVNYHFGGKEGLFHAMLARRLDALHDERLALLDAYERMAAGRPLSCERILAALFVPALRLARDAKRGGKDFLRLLGRAYVDPSPALRGFLSDRYAPSIARFKDAFARALPQITPRELTWRLHFMMGALAYTLAGADAWKLIAALNPADGSNDQLLLRRLAPFLIAGLQAPLPDLTRDDPIAAAAERAPAGRANRRTARARAPKSTFPALAPLSAGKRQDRAGGATNKRAAATVLPTRAARRAA
jgi:AcrR family transcriptional regulator